MKTFIVVCAGIMWVLALVSLCNRRDVDIHRKLSWVVTILVLNVVGALIYFLFGPERVSTLTDDELAVDPDAKPVIPEGKSWNVILGANRFLAGQGLNPKDVDAPRTDTECQHVLDRHENVKKRR